MLSPQVSSLSVCAAQAKTSGALGCVWVVLLLLIDFLCRHHAVGGFPLPADLADGFISKLGKPKSRRTMREPLAVLCHVGILRRVRAAVNGWHLRTPALYALGSEYAKRRITLDVDLPLCLAQKA